MSTTYEIRANDCTGPLLCTIELETNERGQCTEAGEYNSGAVEVAAKRAGNMPAVRRHFGRRSGHGFGVSRETGTPGFSGIFSLHGGGASHGAIHVTKA